MTLGILGILFLLALFSAWCLCRIAALSDQRDEQMRNQFAPAGHHSGNNGGAAAARAPNVEHSL
ncbi:hypothetical protein ACLKMY_00665 [Paraburkholderia mimosarum]|uniref:hypothetical protein n=1 Tax=Paraburkholderia mimosarum TaxID=312026 RepID=UPI0039C1BB81